MSGALQVESRVLAAIAGVSRIAAGALPATERGTLILEQLRSLVPYVAAELSYWDPVGNRHCTVANDGFSDPVLAHLNGPFREDPGYLAIRDARWPGRMRDLSFDVRDFPFYVELLGPAGYAEGLTACLFATDGRYVGMLNLSTAGRDQPSDDARLAIGYLVGTLATVVDVAYTPGLLASLLEPDAPAVAVTAAGALIPLPGRPVLPLLAEDSPLVERARRLLADRSRVESFLWHDEETGWLRVRILRACRCAPDGGDEAIMTVQPTDLPHELTSRELEVLSRLAQGASNREIAAVLVVSPRTVSTHVEHILEKLGVGTRAAAAAIAAREGLLLADACGGVPEKRSLAVSPDVVARLGRPACHTTLPAA